jgi:ABC-2 type transport system ATP-binding protein
MDEAQYLADRVAVIAKGEIVAEGPPASLAGRDRMRTTVHFRPSTDAPAPPAWGQIPTAEGGYLLETDNPTRIVHELTGWALDTGHPLDLLEVRQPTLEDVYLNLTGYDDEGSG